MFMRLKLSLPSAEYDALSKLAVCELRNPHDQIRHILRQELERRGLLPADPAPAQAEPTPREVQREPQTA